MKQNGQDDKKEGEYKNLAVACEILSVELQKSLGAESLKEQLAETKLSQVSGWLSDVAVQTTRMLMGFMVDGERRHDLVCAKLQAIKMPELSDENAYRKAGVQSVKSMAELSNQLDSDRKQLRDLRTALLKLKSSKFALDGGGVLCFQCWTNGKSSMDEIPSNQDRLKKRAKPFPKWRVAMSQWWRLCAWLEVTQ